MMVRSNVANCEFLESSGPLAIAHRGGAAEAEENTLVPFCMLPN